MVVVLDSIYLQNFHYLTVLWGKNVIIFGPDVISSVHIDNKRKDILILGDEP